VQVTVAEPELSLFFGEEITALAASDATLARLLLDARQRIRELERDRDALRAALQRAAAERARMRRELGAIATALTEQLGLNRALTRR